jgi:hypothetical protein
VICNLGTMRVENPLPPFQLYRNNTFCFVCVCGGKKPFLNCIALLMHNFQKGQLMLKAGGRVGFRNPPRPPCTCMTRAPEDRTKSSLTPNPPNILGLRHQDTNLITDFPKHAMQSQFLHSTGVPQQL